MPCSQNFWENVELQRNHVTVQTIYSIVYKWRPCEVYVGPYNTVILKFLKSSMNKYTVSHRCVCNAHLTSYLCKPEHPMSERMKNASKEAYGKDIRGEVEY